MKSGSKVALKGKTASTKRWIVKMKGKTTAVNHDGSILIRSAMPRSKRSVRNNYLIVMGSQK